MPSSRATRRASSTASLPQHEPKRRAGSSDSFHGQTRMVTPITSKPRSTRSAAATDESTPPDMPTTMREDIGLMILGAPAQQFGEPLELLGVGVADLDRAGALAAAERWLPRSDRGRLAVRALPASSRTARAASDRPRPPPSDSDPRGGGFPPGRSRGSARRSHPARPQEYASDRPGARPASAVHR